jgi:Na+/pantothenate symporter
MNADQEKVFRAIMTVIREYTVGDSLTGLVYAVSYVATRAGLSRAAFLKGCGEAYDFAHEHLDGTKGEAS